MPAIDEYIWILWDILALMVFFAVVYRSAARGFAASVAGLLVYIAAAAAAGFVYVRVAGFVYENIVHDIVRHVLVRNFDSWMTGALEAEGIMAAIPFLLRLLVGAKRGEVELLPRDEAALLANSVIDLALREPVMALLNAVAFMLVFAVVAAVMRRLTRVFEGINGIPIIGALNTILGGITGVALGLVVLWLGGLALRLASSLSQGGWFWLNDDVIEATYICRLFY
jgi:uncharacterized membrane protein required for colicin V production